MKTITFKDMKKPFIDLRGKPTMIIKDYWNSVVYGDLKSVGTCPNCEYEIRIQQDEWYKLVIHNEKLFGEDDDYLITYCPICGIRIIWSDKNDKRNKE